MSEIGSKVSKFNLGDKVGVGCIVDSCRTCQSCREDQENYCTKAVATYNGVHHDGTINYGGYSDHIVVDERYAVKIPHTLPLASAAPLLCAGNLNHIWLYFKTEIKKKNGSLSTFYNHKKRTTNPSLLVVVLFLLL